MFRKKLQQKRQHTVPRRLSHGLCSAYSCLCFVPCILQRWTGATQPADGHGIFTGQHACLCVGRLQSFQLLMHLEHFHSVAQHIGAVQCQEMNIDTGCKHCGQGSYEGFRIACHVKLISVGALMCKTSSSSPSSLLVHPRPLGTP